MKKTVSLFCVIYALDGVRFQKFFLLLLTVDSAEEFLDFDFARELHDAINHRLWTRRTARHKHIYRYDVLDTHGYVVALAERTARDGTTAAGNDVFRLGKLVIQTAQYRSHAMDDGAGDHYEVSLTW